MFLIFVIVAQMRRQTQSICNPKMEHTNTPKTSSQENAKNPRRIKSRSMPQVSGAASQRQPTPEAGPAPGRIHKQGGSAGLQLHLRRKGFNYTKNAFVMRQLKRGIWGRALLQCLIKEEEQQEKHKKL